jgi:hypothetical protein
MDIRFMDIRFMDIQAEEMRDRRLHPVMALVKTIV